ncbi:benzaldehyde dehydrogenase [Paenarthrobacter nitroguajacolicus]|uniref:benzaldehyde dehydrogenase n=1 Tax=Paenarthrobacter nitroguajacolicus TaxID=211146 RepID=UPI001AE48977|nr:benzaldehyde dehydrogenase [Paenarthrobacter nitroguajacolicus]MDR6639452.1 benzaldehyde dehydrogenase (NAD) [Paenarthrobacter nitroguajacolicus]
MTTAQQGLLAAATWTGKIYSNGWQAGATVLPIVEPATGDQLGEMGVADASQVARAAESAAAAQPSWAKTPYHERAAVLRRAGELWLQHASEVQEWLIREAGSIEPKAALEVQVASQECFEAAGLTSAPLGEVLPTASDRLSMSRRVPVGVVGVISPFNFPLVLSIRSVAPALALGNAVILKPDPRTAVSGGLSIARIFEEAGLPEGLLHVLPGGVDTGEALVSDPRVPVISFTGSTRAGRSIGEMSARHLKRSHLELGGNSALIVLDDADLEAAVGLGAWGSYLHAGQICMTTGRHIVHESLVDDYVARLAEKANALPVGDPTTGQVALGPIIDDGQRDKIHQLVTSTVNAGAQLVAGGTYEGRFYRPTVLSQVTEDMPAYREEVFGPVAPVISFRSLDDAVRLASAGDYGLSLGIATKDAARGLELAERIPTGIVHVNDQTVNDEPVAPFGGVGASGTGSRFGGATANIEAFTETRWITMRASAPVYPF